MKKMILRLLLTGVAMLSMQVAFGQEEYRRLLDDIAAASAQTGTLECRFVQRQKLSGLSDEAVSEGRLYYKRDNLMRWEYTKPESYAFIVNAGKVVQVRDGVVQKGEGAALFGRIAKLILPGISGKNIVNEKDFTAEYYVADDVFRISMTPKKSSMRRMIERIELSFDVKKKFIRAVEMHRRKDTTKIEFLDEVVNRPLDDKLFSDD
jgi:outer membrane lipoprotein-sorting protein